MNGSGPQVKTCTSSGSGSSPRSMKPCRRAMIARVDGLVPGVGGEVVDLPADVQHGLAQRVVPGGAIGVRDDHLALRAGSARCARRSGSTVVMPAPALASSSGPVRRLDDEIAGRRADLEQVSDLDVVVQVGLRPDRPVRRRRRGPAATVICIRVPTAVEDTVYCRGWRFPSGRSTNTDTYWPGRIAGSAPPSAGSSTSETTSVGLLDSPDHPVRPQRLGRVDTRLLIQPGLLGDQLRREQPVDLVPGGGNLRRHRVTEDLADGGQQVVTDDRCTAPGVMPSEHVLVGDALSSHGERRARPGRSAATA